MVLPSTSCSTNSKLIGIPGLVIRGVNDRVEGGNDATCCLDIAGAASIASRVSSQVGRGFGDLVRLTHLTGCISFLPLLLD